MSSTLNSIKICKNGGHVSRVVAASCPGTLPCVSCALRWRSALCARDARGDVWALVMEVFGVYRVAVSASPRVAARKDVLHVLDLRTNVSPASSHVSHAQSAGGGVNHILTYCF
jgi:hypothetical protein